jgi:hypothetical protein
MNKKAYEASVMVALNKDAAVKPIRFITGLKNLVGSKAIGSIRRLSHKVNPDAGSRVLDIAKNRKMRDLSNAKKRHIEYLIRKSPQDFGVEDPNLMSATDILAKRLSSVSKNQASIPGAMGKAEDIGASIEAAAWGNPNRTKAQNLLHNTFINPEVRVNKNPVHPAGTEFSATEHAYPTDMFSPDKKTTADSYLKQLVYSYGKAHSKSMLANHNLERLRKYPGKSLMSIDSIEDIGN